MPKNSVYFYVVDTSDRYRERQNKFCVFNFYWSIQSMWARKDPTVGPYLNSIEYTKLDQSELKTQNLFCHSQNQSLLTENRDFSFFTDQRKSSYRRQHFRYFFQKKVQTSKRSLISRSSNSTFHRSIYDFLNFPDFSKTHFCQ